MAMLAEPRRKQKWTLNPRGKQWSEDSNKFGQKMLEKMGWTSGKGLGANEQGMTEHIRVSFKNDHSGIGFKGDEMDKAWTEHQDGFNDFLKQLQKTQDVDESPIVETKNETLSGKSLELKSKQSRARVHYHKFTRGKDVNKYSSKDLANIFGQKDLNAGSNTKEANAEEDTEYSSMPIGTQDTRGGIRTIHSGSISDYFKNKGSNLCRTESNTNSRSTDSEEETTYAGFGFSSSQSNNQSDSNNDTKGVCNYGFVNPCMKLESPESIAASSVQQGLKKRKSESKLEAEEESDANGRVKKLKQEPDIESNCKNGFVNAALNIKNENEEVRNGKEFEVSRAQFGLTNSAFDIEDESEKKKRVTFNDHVEYSTDPVKKKKKGKATLDKFEVENKKHKRKRKKDENSTASDLSSGFVNKALDMEDAPAEVQDNEINERKCRKAKKRREGRPSHLETIVEAPEEDKHPDTAETETTRLKENPDAIAIDSEGSQSKKDAKKKKKKKDKIKEENASVQVKKEDIAVSSEGKKKKKKQKHSVDDATEDANTVSTEGEEKPTLNVLHSESNIEATEAKTKELSEEKRRKKAKNGNDDLSTVPEIKTKKEKEVSDKENTNSEEDDVSKRRKSKKSKKDRRKSVDQSVDDDNFACKVEEPTMKTENEAEVETGVDVCSKNHDNAEFKVIRSPWNERARMSKKLLKSLFHRNAISDFPGSNIHEIRGYGEEM